MSPTFSPFSPARSIHVSATPESGSMTCSLETTGTCQGLMPTSGSDSRRRCFSTSSARSKSFAQLVNERRGLGRPSEESAYRSLPTCLRTATRSETTSMASTSRRDVFRADLGSLQRRWADVPSLELSAPGHPPPSEPRCRSSRHALRGPVAAIGAAVRDRVASLSLRFPSACPGATGRANSRARDHLRGVARRGEHNGRGARCNGDRRGSRRVATSPAGRA
jgi:hypothetical protein